jgi:phosphatidylinositol glycan class B
MAHPDEYWQAIEPAYNMAYGGVELTWEWRQDYKIRSTLYPSYLALPMWILKKVGLDYGCVVRTCPYIAHIILVIIYDAYLWRIGKITVGKNSSRVALYILFFARLYNEFMIRTFSNAVETVF